MGVIHRLDIIEDNEFFYRSFPAPDTRRTGKPEYHFSNNNGKVCFSGMAFYDRVGQPSVDRASLIKSPQEIIFDKDNAVIGLLAEEIRKISTEHQKHDVIFEPTEKRPSHSSIVSDPSFIKKNNKLDKTRFYAFVEDLAKIAEKHGWIIEPKHGL